MPNFKDILPFVEDSHYSCNVDWKFLESSLETLGERIVDGKAMNDGLELNPDFQRAHVWSENQQIRYIEYALRGGKTGRDIYWNNPSWQHGYEQPTILVDGKQRLEAVRLFMQDKIPAFGYLYSQWTGKIFSRCGFIFHVNTLQTRAEVLQWYLDLNAGGTPHSSEEISRVRELLKREPELPKNPFKSSAKNV